MCSSDLGALDGAVAQAGVTQIAAHQLLQLRQGEAGEIGRQFLGPDLEQKGRHAQQATAASHCIERVSPEKQAPRGRPPFRYGRSIHGVNV